MSHDDQNTACDSNPERLLDEAEVLIWSLLDDRLDRADATKLCQLIEQDAAVRARYIECVQLHADLTDYFRKPKAPPVDSPRTPVLPDLLPGFPGAGGYSQVTP